MTERDKALLREFQTVLPPDPRAEINEAIMSDLGRVECAGVPLEEHTEKVLYWKSRADGFCLALTRASRRNRTLRVALAVSVGLNAWLVTLTVMWAVTR